MLILIAVLPINSSESVINHTFIVSIRLDYLLHFAIFIPWVFFMQKDIQLNLRRVSTKTLVWIVAGIVFAAAMETIQYLLSYRAFNINDLLANGLGVVLGFVLMILGLFKPTRVNKRIIGEN